MRAKKDGNLFLIGTTKTIVDIRQGQMIARVGGGYINFDKFIAKNQ